MIIAKVCLHQLYRLQVLLACEPVNVDDVGVVATQLASTLLILISEMCSPSLESRPSSEGLITIRYRKETVKPLSSNVHPVPKSLAQLIRRSLMYLLQGYDKLAENHGSGGRIKHDLAKLFGTTIELITDYSRNENLKVPSQRERQKSNSKRSRKQQTAPLGTYQHHSELMALCHLFVAMFASLDTLKRLHNELIEGALYVLLTRAGSLLKTFVFGSDQVGNEQMILRESTQIKDDSQTSESLAATQTEAPYIIWIIERVMHLQGLPAARRPAGQSSGANTNALFFKNIPPTLNQPLAIQAHIKLQNTLLKSIFGNDDTNFEERFRAPEGPELDLGTNIKVIEESDVKNWYKQEIWRLVGWDILRKSIG